ncbi:hypothetical protein GobsT_66080 [Gemmata obscuriglobus]|uniref:TIGR02996 domain-containing protein n=1 Tax=Gemmata obscuriglobus TaxID=114 RepID=A0A2Z3GWF4_9BACT|nr:TIGR02996 domain-containing protein [Gemmata obscuriglobus]AWM35706.1 TIGR02996 domain-containing protein [Gemmata obscuriglobus]QEG31764.1 hypothetical protein GobsT_66080 [Gemmata obscuriglobus]VTS11110.1 Type IV fimbrial assembly, ATPase PilB OS=Hyalangium minutum GN=DB31_0730 PE=4 SV=1 [Gemmata obscuriglobus UQM 2246]
MNDEAGFLRALLDAPADDTTRLVLADWLDERGDPESQTKAHFLRASVRLAGTNEGANHPTELRDLAHGLPPEWVAVASKVPVERCADPAAKPSGRPNAEAEFQRLGVRFNFICDQRWDELRPTGDARVRHCERCQKSVRYCDTMEAARAQAKFGNCIAVSPAEERETGDLDIASKMLTLGAPGLI